MDFFKIGDTIVYPNQGLGVIEDIQKENYYGEEFIIYHVRILANETLVLVPFANAQEIGIRKPISQKAVQKIYQFMRNGGVDVTMNWKGRYKEHVNLMKTVFAYARCKTILSIAREPSTGAISLGSELNCS